MSDARPLTAHESYERDAWYRDRSDAHREAGRMIRAARVRQGLSPEQVARAVGRARGSVKCWESGQVPGPESRAALCALLELDSATIEALYATNSGPWPDPREAASLPGGAAPSEAREPSEADREVVVRAAFEEIREVRKALGLQRGESLLAEVRRIAAERERRFVERGMKVAREVWDARKAAARRATGATTPQEKP